MARGDDERRRAGGQGTSGDERWAGHGEPWPGRGQMRNRDEERGEGEEWSGRAREHARAEPTREEDRGRDARSAGSRGYDSRGGAGRSGRARALEGERSQGDPSVGDEAGGWRRSTQYELTGEGPGSYGPEAARRAWRTRPLGRGPKGYRRPDERIHDDLSERFALSNVNTEDVEVSVQDGQVTLSGHVETRWDKRALEEMAEDTFGVTQVENRLRLDSPLDRARRANRVGDTREDLPH